MDDKQIILALGGTAAVAKLLGTSQQRVNNWMTRGIPPKVKLENQDLFVVNPPQDGDTGDMKLYELRMQVLFCMRSECPKKAAEVFEKWAHEVKESGSGNH